MTWAVWPSLDLGYLAEWCAALLLVPSLIVLVCTVGVVSARWGWTGTWTSLVVLDGAYLAWAHMAREELR